MSTENGLQPLVLLHGSADYNVPIIARYGLAGLNDHPTLAVNPKYAVFYTRQHFTESVQLYCTVWYPKEGDVKASSPSNTFYSIQSLLEETTRLKISQDIEDSLRGKKPAEYIASELQRLKYAKQLLAPDRLGGYFSMDLLQNAEENPGLVNIDQLFDELLKCQLVCCNGKTADQIASDILVALALQAKY